MIKYVDSILTTHVCKVPADLESGLGVLLKLKGKPIVNDLMLPPMALTHNALLQLQIRKSSRMPSNISSF